MLRNNVVELKRLARPRVFTTNEELIDEVREELWKSGISWKRLAEQANLGQGTVQRLASGQTKWPRPTTLFPLLQALGLGLAVVRNSKLKRNT